MTHESRVGLIRLIALFGPVLITALVWRWRRPPLRARAAALLSTTWCFVALLIVNIAALRFGWWRFGVRGGTLLGVPVDAVLGWSLLWGVATTLAFPKGSLLGLAALALWVDLLGMGQGEPALVLGQDWLHGEFAALALAFVPAQYLARWTIFDRRLPLRVGLQVVLFGAVNLWLVPTLAFDLRGGDWGPLFEGPVWQRSFRIQAALAPGLLGLAAVLEFMSVGGGTPIPYDPPKRLVTTGPYAYIANPMQLSMVLLLVTWGTLLNNIWVVAAAIVAVAYSAGIAEMDERGDLAARHGAGWVAYRQHVRAWLPRWRPYIAAPSEPDGPQATLYFAAGCGPCEQVAAFVRQRHPVGLTLTPAQQHPDRDLDRLTYASGAVSAEGVAALARALEHVNFGWALLSFLVRLPGVVQLVQLLVDASGGGRRVVPRDR